MAVFLKLEKCLISQWGILRLRQQRDSPREGRKVVVAPDGDANAHDSFNQRTIRSGFLDPSAPPAATAHTGDVVGLHGLNGATKQKFGMSFAEREPLAPPVSARPQTFLAARKAMRLGGSLVALNACPSETTLSRKCDDHCVPARQGEQVTRCCASGRDHRRGHLLANL